MIHVVCTQKSAKVTWFVYGAAIYAVYRVSNCKTVLYVRAIERSLIPTSVISNENMCAAGLEQR